MRKKNNSELCMIAVRASELKELNQANPEVKSIPLDCQCPRHKDKNILRTINPKTKEEQKLYPHWIKPIYGVKYV